MPGDIPGETKSLYQQWISELVIPIVLAVIVYFFVTTFLFQTSKVFGSSMYPTLDGNEMLIVNKLLYRVSPPKYGDVVIFHTSEKRDFIKRVIGLPGDKIHIEGGKVYRNQQELQEAYVSSPTLASIQGEDIEVAPGEIVVLGDNRENSTDSRIFGPVKMKDLVGRAEAVIYPFSKVKMLHE